MNEFTLIEGAPSVLAVLTAESREVQKVIISKNLDRRKKLSLMPIIRRAQVRNIPIQELEREKIDEICAGKTHGGVAAYVGQRKYTSLQDALKVKDGFFVLLDGVEDPYNFGQALRAIYASGADGILLPERNWMSASSVVARSSAGASEYVSAISDDLEEAVKAFKEKGYRIVLCDNTSDSVPMQEAMLKKPLVLVIGGEMRGVCAKLKAYKDVEARIEYGREFNASLGAAEATTILAFEVLRQNP